MLVVVLVRNWKSLRGLRNKLQILCSYESCFLVKIFYFLYSLCSVQVYWSQFSLFLQRKTETMNGNWREKSETESSSSLESRDHLLLIAYKGTHISQHHLMRTHKKKGSLLCLMLGIWVRLYFWLMRSQVLHPKDRVTHHHRSFTFFN